jgi:uncharacterized protein (DUF1697 family)
VPTYIALLRALNVGGRFYKMADLRADLAESGLGDVETYIQTGNVRFTTSRRSAAKVERHVEAVLAEHCGFEVPAIILSPAELRQVYDDAMAIPPPSYAAEGQRRYVIFFKPGDVPAEEAAARIAAWEHPGESAVAIGRVVHVWLAHATHEAKLFGALKRVIGAGTNRDLKVVRALAERWGD